MVSAVPVVLFDGLQEEVTHPGSPSSGLFFVVVVVVSPYFNSSLEPGDLDSDFVSWSL